MKNLMRVSIVYLIIVLIPLSFLGAVEEELFTRQEITLDYISPTELVESLVLEEHSARGYNLSVNDSLVHLRVNESSNKILLSGNPNLIEEAKEIVEFFDVPPRQIVIEVKIVRIDNQKADEIGMDWQTLLNRTYFSLDYRNDMNDDEENESRDYSEGGDDYSYHQEQDLNSEDRKFSASLGSDLGDLLKLIKETDVGKVTSTPHIVTTNNKTGRILDGDRITYVTRYSSYTNLFETQELTAGLSLSVTPTIGESGYLKLDVIAKLTSLGEKISGSPSESGQILENTVVVKDQEPFVLGGFKNTTSRKIKRKVPILGSILPFLFSSEKTVESTRDVMLILTPKIIDLESRKVPNMEIKKE